jgi:hypothetical protein
MRTYVAWIIGIGIVPALALLRYKLAPASDTSAELAFHFSVAYVWPTFAAGGLLGFPLLRLPRKHLIPLSFLMLGVICGIVAAFIAPHFYPYLANKETRYCRHEIG